MDLPDGWTTGTVAANGVDLHHDRTGEGPPVVFAHGMYDHGRRWVRLGSDLADGYEAWEYGLERDSGGSDPPTGDPDPPF